jgi:hypothetical protein
LDKSMKVSGSAADGGYAPVDDAVYDRLFPYHAEICAMTELRKKPDFGVPVRSGIGGHLLLYLSGVQLDRAAGYPTLKLCDPDASPARHGAGISVNAHYKNANWVAAEGRDFLWWGALAPGERLTGDAYERTQRHAKAIGMLEGVQFHDHLFRERPKGMSERDYMYEISIATDYAARFGRDTYHARIPLDRKRMAAIVDFLNGLNAPYRAGHKIFRWRVINNNCVHVIHNALSAAGIWAHWPTGQFVGRAAFNFPVPKNEFVDLMLRTNDLPIQDAHAIYNDAAARRALLETGTLPVAPGALANAGRAIRANDLYDVHKLRLIFFDNPFWGPYRFHFDRILKEPRYVDLRANLQHFAQLYATALKSNFSAGSQETRGISGEQARFLQHYTLYIAREAARVNHLRASLEEPAERLAEAAS